MNSKKTLRKRGSNASLHNDRRNSTKEIRIGKDAGRVKVFVRVRPLSSEEKSRKDSLPFEIYEDNRQMKIFADDRGHPEKTYSLDHIFAPSKTNKHVCDVMTTPLVQSAMNGFNGTLMAYGQTGSGKTFTLMADTGITRNLIARCFQKIQDDLHHVYKVTVSYLQIYQEKIFDLLTNDHNKGELTIRENPKTGVYVENLSEYVVRSPTEVLQFIAAGKKRLVFAETKMNRTSSRSHAVLQLCIEKTLKDESDPKPSDTNSTGKGELRKTNSMSSLDLHSFGKDVIVRGRLHICDLAGSERIKKTGASGDRLSEAQHINSSLLELGNVIQALADEKATHVPFRNSILTRLLQESLGGNCKTSLIVCVSPSSRDLHETKCTLNFGSRAMKVQNTAYVNMEVDFKSLSDQLLKQLQLKDEEISELKQSYQHQMEVERDTIKLKFHQMYEENLTDIEQEKEMFKDKLKTTEDEKYVLSNELHCKINRIQELEDSVFAMDDMLKHEKSFGIQLLKTENKIIELLTSYTTDDVIVNQSHVVDSVIGALEQWIRIDLSDDDEGGLFDIFQGMQEDIGKIQMSTKEIIEENLQRLTEKLDRLKECFTNSYSDVTSLGDESDLNFAKYHLFLSNCLHCVSEKLNQMSLTEQIEKLSTTEPPMEQLDRKDKLTLTKDQLIQCDLITENKNKPYNQNMSNELRNNKSNPIDLSDSVDGRSFNDLVGGINGDLNYASPKITKASTTPQFKNTGTHMERMFTHNIGVQTVDFQKEEKVPSPKTGRKLISTTVEDVEKVITDIETENVVENKELRNSRDIFSGFGSTLDRIEGMVRNDRSTRPVCSIASRFGLGTYFREEDNLRRKSSFDYRFDSSYNSAKFNSSTKFNPVKDNAADRYERLAKYSSRSYDSSQEFDSSFSRSFEDTLPLDNHAKLKDLYCKLSGKYRELETSNSQLKLENQEFEAIIEQLIQLVPSNNQVDEIKLKVKERKSRCSAATQTNGQTNGTLDTNTKKVKFSNVKVAHVKPRLSEEAIAPANSTINISYDLNENNIVRNIANLQAPQSSPIVNHVTREDFKISKSNATHGNVDVTSNWLKETDLLEFSPENEDNPIINDTNEKVIDNRDYTSKIFKTLREKDEVHIRSSLGSPSSEYRERPQTWFGYPEHFQKDSLHVQANENIDDVTFSRARSSWALPDWMKGKSKKDLNFKQFIQ